jgi:hypothetical protein
MFDEGSRENKTYVMSSAFFFLEVLPLEKLLQQYSRAGSMAQILLSSS